MKTKDYTDPAAFLRDAYGRPRTSRRSARDARPNLPRAAPAERTGLSGLIRRGWSVTMDGERYRLTRGECDTGWADEKTACDQAKKLEAEG